MEITYLGHACIQINAGGKTILVDPFISVNDLAQNIDVDSLQPDYILITHAHQDHVLDVKRIVRNCGATLISNYEIITYYNKMDFLGHGMNTGGSYTFDFGRLTATVAQHSSMFADGSYGGNPNGYVLQSDDKIIYIAGDTAVTLDMKLLPEMFGIMDLVVLPIGDNFTMGPKEAVKASDLLECNTVLGYHYDTFEQIKIDHEETKKLFEQKGKKLHLLPIGDSIKV